MKRCKLISAAKINLSLDITGLREDGYHLLRSVMQSVSLFDVMTAERRGAAGEIKIFCNLPYVPTDERNTAYKAAARFFEATGIQNPGVSFSFRKKIPVGAGLAGGSGNAAAVLTALGRMFDVSLSEADFAALCAAVGADVAFCARGGTQLCEGIGDRLTALPPLSERYAIVLAKPNLSVSTKKVYTMLDEKTEKPPFATDRVIAALTADETALCRAMGNHLEPVTEELCPAVAGLKEAMLSCGAYGAMMSGSGPTVFGVFPDDESAMACAAMIRTANRGFYTRAVHPVDFGVKVING